MESCHGGTVLFHITIPSAEGQRIVASRKPHLWNLLPAARPRFERDHALRPQIKHFAADTTDPLRADDALLGAQADEIFFAVGGLQQGERFRRYRHVTLREERTDGTLHLAHIAQPPVAVSTFSAHEPAVGRQTRDES